MKFDFDVEMSEEWRTFIRKWFTFLRQEIPLYDTVLWQWLLFSSEVSLSREPQSE